MINTSPPFTDAPVATLIPVTLPDADAWISFSIFIASRIISTSPLFTVSPTATLMSNTVPGIGAVTALPPAGAAVGAGVAAFGAAAGTAAFGAAGAAGLGAAALRADGAPPISSTSTSYDLPFTVILNFSLVKSP